MRSHHGLSLSLSAALLLALAGCASTGATGMQGSLNNNSGFTTVFQNTGNNVLFQSSTVVNITVR